MVGSFSNRPRIVNDVNSAVFEKLPRNLGELLVVAGAVFGDVGG